VSTLFDLMDDVPDWVHVAEPESIEQRFWTFHTAHPDVYRELVVLARRARAAGRERLGMKMLFEVVRWNRTMAGLPADGEEFKLNNNYTSRYARLLMEREAGLSGLFATRELRAA
jgi:hypothetical protein